MKNLFGPLMLFLALGTSAQTTIDLQGHRGARGLLPENTLPAFSEALKLGVTTLELDVVSTKDGVLVISHDPALNPAITRDKNGQFLGTTGPNIIDLTIDQVAQYDVGKLDPSSEYAKPFSSQRSVDGARIPRLTELFKLVKDSGNEKVRFAIEIKMTPEKPALTPDPENFVKMLMKDVIDAGLLSRVSVLCFDWRPLQVIQRDYPAVPTVYLTAQGKALDNIRARSDVESPWNAGFTYKKYGSIPKMIKAAGGRIWSSYYGTLNAGSVAEARSLGIQVIAWTVNDRETMQKMVDLGVDGLVTDRPDIAIALLRDRKIAW